MFQKNRYNAPDGSSKKRLVLIVGIILVIVVIAITVFSSPSNSKVSKLVESGEYTTFSNESLSISYPKSFVKSFDGTELTLTREVSQNNAKDKIVVKPYIKNANNVKLDSLEKSLTVNILDQKVADATYANLNGSLAMTIAPTADALVKNKSTLYVKGPQTIWRIEATFASENSPLKNETELVFKSFKLKGGT